MLYFYEVIEGSKWHKAAENMFNWRKPWHDNQELIQFMADLGLDKENLLLQTHVLEIVGEPVKNKNEFCKPHTREIKNSDGTTKMVTTTAARKNSAINKAYLDLLKRNNLTKYDWWAFKDDAGLNVIERVGFSINKRFDRYYVINSTSDLSERHSSSLKLIKETEWLEIELRFKREAEANAMQS